MSSPWIQETNTKMIIKPTVPKKLCAFVLGGDQETVGDNSYTLSLISSALQIIRS